MLFFFLYLFIQWCSPEFYYSHYWLDCVGQWRRKAFTSVNPSLRDDVFCSSCHLISFFSLTVALEKCAEKPGEDMAGYDKQCLVLGDAWNIFWPEWVNKSIDGWVLLQDAFQVWMSDLSLWVACVEEEVPFIGKKCPLLEVPVSNGHL